mmetsp:Transcript_3068/g.5415  ORF Transcript_3068/g.5415 Transcript_3068/m.5415 type:complete len:153 (+) Transcript_3068:640-1098(+)
MLNQKLCQLCVISGNKHVFDELDSRTRVTKATKKRGLTENTKGAIPLESIPKDQLNNVSAKPAHAAPVPLSSENAPATVKDTAHISIGRSRRFRQKKTRSRQKNLRKDSRTGDRKPEHLTDDTLARGRLRRPPVPTINDLKGQDSQNESKTS